MSPTAYPATLEPDEDGRTVVSFHDLVGAHTDGATRAEALWESRDCLREAVMANPRETEISRRLPRPGSTTPSRRTVGQWAFSGRSQRTMLPSRVHDADEDKRRGYDGFMYDRDALNGS